MNVFGFGLGFFAGGGGRFLLFNLAFVCVKCSGMDYGCVQRSVNSCFLLKAVTVYCLSC